MSRIKPYLLPAIGLALVLAAAAFLNRQHAQLADARRSVEALQLEKAGQIVAHAESAKDLQATVAELTKKNSDLAEALAAAHAAAPDAKAVHAAKLSTGAVVVEASEPEKATAPEGAVGPDRGALNSAPPARADTIPAAAGAQQACVLSIGDQASIEVDQVTLKTNAGNFLVVGTAQAYREQPGPRSLLFGGKFQSALSDSSGLALPPAPRWGAGLTGACSSSGCALGPALAFPPLRVFGFQLEATAGLPIGAGGAALTATAVGRW